MNNFQKTIVYIIYTKKSIIILTKTNLQGTIYLSKLYADKVSADWSIKMDNEYEADLITLLDEDGTEHEFEVIDELETDDGHFVALVPTTVDDTLEAETYYIFEIVEEDGEEQLMEVENEELLDKLAQMFETRFEEEFYEEN